jgi:hypothetical protein
MKIGFSTLRLSSSAAADWFLTPDNLKAAAHILVFEANQLTSNL